jgi:hypothetical protein
MKFDRPFFPKRRMPVEFALSHSAAKSPSSSMWPVPAATLASPALLLVGSARTDFFPSVKKARSVQRCYGQKGSKIRSEAR